MNKTIIINISGIIFHIEEDAYELLKQYMNEVKRHFASSADSFEIVTDIENRIAEMFSEILKRESKQVITSEDVNGVVAQMGRPADFDEDSAVETELPRMQKRLYRNPDDKILGGVCGGIAAYFNVNPLWIRLATVALFLLYGFGVFLYPLLWIIMPMARTRTEKLALRGEPVTIGTIKKSVEEELGEVKVKASELKEEAKQVRTSGAMRTLQDFISNLVDLIGKFLKEVFRIAGKLIGIMMMAFGFFGITGLSVALLVMLGVISTEVSGYFPFSFIEQEKQLLFFLTGYAAVVIPFIALLLGGIKMVFQPKTLGRNMALFLFVGWIVAASFSGVMTSRALAGFKEEGSLKEVVGLSSTKSNTYYLKLDETYTPDGEDSMNNELMQGRVILDEEETDFGIKKACLHIEKSEDGQVSLEKKSIARGKDFNIAIQNASRISYNFSQQDSVLLFSRDFRTPKGELFRAQEMELTLKVPEGTTLVIDRDVYRIMKHYELYECADDNTTRVDLMMRKQGLDCAEGRVREWED